MNVIAVLLAFAVSDPPPIENPDPPTIERRISDLEKRVESLESVASFEEPADLTYSAAYAKSLRTGKPLVTWVGGNFCPRCVNDTSGEFIHCFVDRFEGASAPSLVVSVPKDGELLRVADITQWVEGDSEFGHMPTTRKALEHYRRTGFVTDHRVRAPDWSVQTPTILQRYPPMRMMGQSMESYRKSLADWHKAQQTFAMRPAFRDAIQESMRLPAEVRRGVAVCKT